jgi:hypothetical protein
MTKLILVASSLFVLSGCVTPREGFIGGFNGGKPGLDLAAFELECPRDQLEVVDLGNWEIGVKGCGKKATFGNHAGVWYRIGE